jgi:hypothetical protein
MSSAILRSLYRCLTVETAVTIGTWLWLYFLGDLLCIVEKELFREAGEVSLGGTVIEGGVIKLDFAI